MISLTSSTATTYFLIESMRGVIRKQVKGVSGYFLRPFNRPRKPKLVKGKPPKRAKAQTTMKEMDTTTTTHTEHQETAVLPETLDQTQLAQLFDEGWNHLIHHRWQQAEQQFAQIEAANAHYERDNLHVTILRKKARHERKAAAALALGKLDKALNEFRKADDFKYIQAVQEQFTLQEMERKAEKAKTVANYQEAAWIYDYLLNTYNVPEKTTEWESKKEKYGEEALLPYFHIGVQAMESQQWRTAYSAFAQVLKINPHFRKGGRSAAALAEMVRKEVVLWADRRLRQGQVKEALDAYRQVGHMARIENVAEFLRLRQHEEEIAQQLEAEGKWQEAAAKYRSLCTLYYDENGQARWQAAANRCLERKQAQRYYPHDKTLNQSSPTPN